MKRSDVISNDRIRAGDVVVGLASYGKATYETEYNGGMGSNGLTSAAPRRLRTRPRRQVPRVLRRRPFRATLVYSGKYALTDVEPETG